ncbi:MAG: hypothetical protein MZW92_67195 [Comamonadaceae bacterium]|nr:hypothetical protein [Comamonadaceae bacterium]
MEKAGDVLVADGDFGWSDVGAWSTLLEIWPRDRDGNAVRGESVALDAKGCLVWNPGRLTALVGVRDLIVVEAGDALLVCDASLDQRVKDVVAALKRTPKNRKYVYNFDRSSGGVGDEQAHSGPGRRGGHPGGLRPRPARSRWTSRSTSWRTA